MPRARCSSGLKGAVLMHLRSQRAECTPAEFVHSVYAPSTHTPENGCRCSAREGMTESMPITEVLQAEETLQGEGSPLARLGIPPALGWGFLGLLLFMIGDGVESGYLSPFLAQRGFAPTTVAWVFTAYGSRSESIAGWLSGALYRMYGDRGESPSASACISGSRLRCCFSVLDELPHSGNLWILLATYSLAGTGLSAVRLRLPGVDHRCWRRNAGLGQRWGGSGSRLQADCPRLALW